MAEEIRTTGPREPGSVGPRGAAAEPSLGELFKELAQESSTLIKQEIGLARIEMRDNVRRMTKDLVLLAAGGGILLVGLLTLTAFLVAGLGDLLGDEYWLGALIVGVVYALVGGLLLVRGKSGMRHDDLKPEHTLATLREDKQWAAAEARQLKRDLTS